MQSRYCYPNTDVLINYFGITDQGNLSILEAEITNMKLMFLLGKPLNGFFDLKHMQAIHKFLFEDIYPFAGQLREENIAKDYFSFANCLYIKSNADELFEKLHKENNLLNLQLKEFSLRAAHYMAELNVLHPFREGNGRTIREFIRALALNAGYQLDWSLVSREQVMRASIKSVADETDLAGVIERAIDKKNKRRVRNLELDR